MTVTKVSLARDNVPALMGHGIGVSEGARGGDSIFMAFARPPMPILCLFGLSEMPTTEEILFIRAYQEFKVADFGFQSHNVPRKEGIPFVPGANTEIWCKNDGVWQYRLSSWISGPFFVPIEGCGAIEALPNVVDRCLWNDLFRDNMAIIFPALVELDKHWDIEINAERSGGFRLWVGERRTLVHVLEDHLIVAYDDCAKDHRKFDIADPNCYDHLVEFIHAKNKE